MVTVNHTTILLNRMKALLAHQREVQALRGERFNVFSILGMESAENATHSAFLVELLNPNGSHGKGETFLRLFLRHIGAAETLNAEGATVRTEYGIGGKDTDALTGGRLDILLTDRQGRCLTIENKIHAPDQPAQVQRYCNYRKGANTVYYLTLLGTEPTDASKGALRSGTDFHLISYGSHIAAWLEDCHRAAADSPILRETVKQYLLLVKKLTGTMTDPQHETQLAALLMDHYEEAKYIAASFDRLCQQLQQEVRANVVEALKVKLPPDMTVAEASGIGSTFAKIWVWFKGYNGANLCFGAESFNGTGHYGGDLFVGVFNNGVKSKGDGVRPKVASGWRDESFPQWKNHRINLGDGDLLKQLQNNPALRKELAEAIATAVWQYVKDRKDDVWKQTKALNEVVP